MTNIYVSESGHHWIRQWLGAYSVPSHYLNQCCVIVNGTLRKEPQWNLNRNTKLFIQENVFENVVCEMAAILSMGDELTKHFILCSILLEYVVWKHAALTLGTMPTNCLGHWRRDKKAAHFLMTFSNAFSWMQIYQFRKMCRWNLFLRA